MHSFSIIMAAGSHGSTYYGGVPLRPIHRPVFLQRDASVIMARRKSAERPLRATTLAALAFSKSIASYVDLKALANTRARTPTAPLLH